jgi:protein phosphatase-4 regulatory subunit 3
MPRDNLLSSACLEFFEHIKKEGIKDLIKHIVENYRDQLHQLEYVELFQHILARFDQTRGFTINLDYFLESEDDVAARRRNTVNPRTGALMEHITMDHAEEEYWNTSDDEEDMQAKAANRNASVNGSSPATKLVDYASDEDVDENIEAGDLGSDAKAADERMDDSPSKSDDASVASTPPERLSEKRRREEDEEEDLGKLISHKRRNSTSASSNASSTSGILRKRKGVANARDAGGGVAPKKISISLSPTIKAGGGQAGGKQDDET